MRLQYSSSNATSPTTPQPPPKTPPLPSRQTTQQPPQLPQHNPLLRRRSIPLRRRNPHTNTRKASPLGPHNLTLRRQPRLPPARTHITRRPTRRGVDPRQHEFELRGRGTAGAAHGWEIDVEPDVRGQVWFSGRDETLREVGREGRVDGDVVGYGGRGICDLRSGGAAKGDGGDPFFRRLRRCTHGSGYLGRGAEVRYK